MSVYYSARHILLEDQEDAEDILRYIQKGETFEDMAKEYSECETGAKGGDLGTFTSGVMDPEFEKALYHLKIGEISKPVKTKFGYHLIKRLK
jgi:parvulin-like peptidyl-prolyl isomerase